MFGVEEDRFGGTTADGREFNGNSTAAKVGLGEDQRAKAGERKTIEKSGG
jgi:hypothetical protein